MCDGISGETVLYGNALDLREITDFIIRVITDIISKIHAINVPRNGIVGKDVRQIHPGNNIVTRKAINDVNATALL